MRYVIEFSYNGTNYHGWQKQPNASTVQEELSKCLSFQLDEEVELVGAGRTDAGVHALQMFAHFDTENKINNTNLVFKLNSFLSDDILIHSIFKVTEEFHARFNALERTYQYFVSTKKNIFNDNIYFVSSKLDCAKMNEASQFLIGKQDFTSFSKLHTDTSTNNCNIIKAMWVQQEDNLIFSISSNRFLRNMVRSIVGTLIDVGKGKINPSIMKDIIAKKNRCEAGFSVPAKALFLKEIKYPPEIKR